MNFTEPKLIGDSAVIDNTIIKDSEIFQKIGYKNYVQLQRKYPNYFKYFTECDSVTDCIGFIPSNISLYITDDPNIIKCDIVKTIYYKVWVSPVSDLILNSTDKVLCNPTEFENTTSITIFIYIILVSLIVFAIYILTISPYMVKLMKTKNFELNNPYYININPLM